ncbi:MAG: hypothetical protein K8R37_04935 [Bacteroidales bacterium]|nr:hypothetical protein [Bacteroidales bacterium]
MKKIIRSVILLAFLFFSPIFLNNIFADCPPDPGGGPGSGDPPVGGGSPVGGGLLIMISLGAIYGSKKVFDARKKILE